MTRTGSFTTSEQGWCSDSGADSSGHRLRRRIRLARHLRTVRHHGRAAGVCLVRPEPYPGAGAGLLVGRADPGRRPAAVRGRPAACHRAGRDDGFGVGCAVRRGRYRTAGIRHRAVVQADPLWLHERHRPDGDRQPIAGAVRLRRPGPWAAGRVPAIRVGPAGRQDKLAGAGHRRRHAADDSAAQAPSASAGRLDRRRRRDLCRHLADLAQRAGVPVLGALPQGLPGFALPSMGVDDIARCCSVDWRWR